MKPIAALQEARDAFQAWRPGVLEHQLIELGFPGPGDLSWAAFQTSQSRPVALSRTSRPFFPFRYSSPVTALGPSTVRYPSS